MLDYATQCALLVTCLVPVFHKDWFLATQTLSTLILSLLAALLVRGVHPAFAPVFLSAVLFNASGWVFGFYETFPPYDEISHFITPTVFTMVLGGIITKIFYNRIAKRVPFFFYILLALGVALGAVWEIGEYIFFTYIQTRYEMTMEDTISDLALDVLGAAIGSYIISRWDKDKLVRSGSDLREIPYIAMFDSATSMVRHLTHVLHKRDSKGLQMLPVVMTPLLSLSTIIPRQVRSWFFQHSGRLDALHPDYTSEVNIHQIGNAICENYPQKKYPVIMFGSANGALTHLCAAMGIPYLPQTLPLLVRKDRMNPEEPVQDLEWGKPYAEELLALNPDLHISQMVDPVHDRIMSQVICYFRIKIIGLIESYKRFMIDTLEPGGTILISNCTKQWLVHTINDRYTFQVGGAGDLTAEEYNNGSKRLEQFLKNQGVRKKKLSVPEPDAYRPEAEWGYDTRITEDITAFAKKHGFTVEMITYEEPEDPSAFIADLYRSWYTDLGYEADRLFVEFLCIWNHIGRCMLD